MNAPNMPIPNWTEANQQFLSAELARIKALLRGESAESAQEQVAVSRAMLAEAAAIDRLTERFGLSSFERDVLLLATGVEMDSEFAALCAGAGVNGQRAWASFGLALAVLPDPHWSALAPVRPLRQWRLIETGDESGLTTARVRVDERVLHYLGGVNFLDVRLQSLMRQVDAPSEMADSQIAIAQDIVAALEQERGPLPVFQFTGRDDHGKRDIASWIAAHLGLRLYVMAGDDIPAAPGELDALAVLWEREIALLDGALLIECGEGSVTPAARRFAERIGGVLFLAVHEPAALIRQDRRFEVDKPTCGDQLQLWQRALGSQAEGLAGALDGVASEFRLSARDIQRIGSGLARSKSPEADPEVALWQACRSQEARRIDGLAQRIEPSCGWDDLVLPEPQKAALHQIAAHLRHRPTVYQRWGFATKGARGLGISALLSLIHI